MSTLAKIAGILPILLFGFSPCGIVYAQNNFGAGPGLGDAASQQLGQFKRSAIGQGYTIDSTNRMSLNGVRPLQTQNLTGTPLAGAGLRPVSAAANNMPSPAPATRRARVGGAAGVSGPVSKPFSNITRRPTVSPYLLLFNDEDGTNENNLNFQTLVRPMLQQEAFNEQVNRDQLRINQQLTALAGQSAFQPQGSQQIAPTGHAAVFNNTLNFFPQRRR